VTATPLRHRPGTAIVAWNMVTAVTSARYRAADHYALFPSCTMEESAREQGPSDEESGGRMKNQVTLARGASLLVMLAGCKFDNGPGGADAMTAGNSGGYAGASSSSESDGAAGSSEGGAAGSPSCEARSGPGSMEDAGAAMADAGQNAPDAGPSADAGNPAPDGNC